MRPYTSKPRHDSHSRPHRIIRTNKYAPEKKSYRTNFEIFGFSLKFDDFSMSKILKNFKEFVKSWKKAATVGPEAPHCTPDVPLARPNHRGGRRGPARCPGQIL